MWSRLAVVLVCVVVLTLGACAPAGGGSVEPVTVDDVLASLQGLAFREFLDASYKDLLLRNPEVVTSLGLSATFGVRNDKLTDVSPEFILETYALYGEILDLLRTYDRSALSAEDQLSYDIYEWYLDDWVRGEPYAFHDYSISGIPLSGWSADATLVTLFTDDHPLVTKDDLDDYVTRLSLVNGKMTQLVEALKYREERGILPAQFTVDMATSRLRGYLGVSGTARVNASQVRVEGTILWTSFRDRLAAMQGISDETKNDALAAVRDGIRTSFIPGYVALLTHLEGIRSRAPVVGGATSLPDGQAYYAYKLRDQTTLDLTAEAARATGLSEVSRIQTEMRDKYAALGLSLSQSMLDLRWAANADAPTCDLSTEAGRQAYLAENERVLDLAAAAVAQVCSLTPEFPLDIRPAPPGSGSCYFAPGSLDGSRSGAYYVNMDGGVTDFLSVPVVAYHEGIPGHYFQMTIAAGLDLPLFRRCEAPHGVPRRVGPVLGAAGRRAGPVLDDARGLGAPRPRAATGVPRGHRHGDALPGVVGGRGRRILGDRARLSGGIAVLRHGPLRRLPGTRTLLHDGHARVHGASTAGRRRARRPVQSDRVPRPRSRERRDAVPDPRAAGRRVHRAKARGIEAPGYSPGV